MKKIKPPKLVTVSVFTTITIIFWIFFGVYNILTSDININVDDNLLKPINTNLDTQVLGELQNKRFYDSSLQVSVFNNITDTNQAAGDQAQESVEIDELESTTGTGTDEQGNNEELDEDAEEILEEPDNAAEEDTL